MTTPPNPITPEELCHHQHPLGPPGRVIMSHPMSEPCLLREAALRTELSTTTAALADARDFWPDPVTGEPLEIRALYDQSVERGARAIRAESQLTDARRERDEARATSKELRRQITFARENNEKRNRELDTLHYVWCDGGCGSGVHRYHEETLTAELVAIAMRNTQRLLNWYVNNAGHEDSTGTVAARGPLWAKARERVGAALIDDAANTNAQLTAARRVIAGLREALQRIVSMSGTGAFERGKQAREALSTSQPFAQAHDDAVRREALEEATKLAIDYASAYMSEDTHGSERKAAEQIATAIRRLASKEPSDG